MNNLSDLTNAGDRGAISQDNFEAIDASLAFGMTASLGLDGDPTLLLGAPTEGTFVEGQFWVDAALAIWRCTAGGTPGTWVQQTAAVVTAEPIGAPAEYLIKRADLHWKEYYFDGAVFQLVNP
jgi:hypothetical protein